ncbi:hypothetical protein FHX16_006288 [Rhizobium sp. BK661]|nr:hypothetical protein [Rhizobium sp. BK661]
MRCRRFLIHDPVFECKFRYSRGGFKADRKQGDLSNLDRNDVADSDTTEDGQSCLPYCRHVGRLSIRASPHQKIISDAFQIPTLKRRMRSRADQVRHSHSCGGFRKPLRCRQKSRRSRCHETAESPSRCQASPCIGLSHRPGLAGWKGHRRRCLPRRQARHLAWRQSCYPAAGQKAGFR